MSDSTSSPSRSNGANIHAHRLLWAGFIAILAEGVGFAVRGGILGQWSQQYGFTQTELGQITGGGLTGFGVIIIISSLIADKIGYGALMFGAFIFHVASALVTLLAGYAFIHHGKASALNHLSAGMFLFAMGNGLCEGVANPLVASLFPKDKSKFLNILHAGWPGGLILGALASFFMAGGDGRAPVSWQVQMCLFLVPVALYGLMLFGQKFPKSEASAHQVKYSDMLKEIGMMGALIICFLLALWFHDLCQALNLPGALGIAGGAVLLIVFGVFTKFSPGYFLMVLLLIIHSIQGYVELGTDSWVGKITNSFMHSDRNGLLLFAYISGLMFALRFFAGPIVDRISPVGLLFGSAVLTSIGLVFLGHADTAVLCIVAATVYSVGKTFVWPTLLAVASERFPKGGAITIGAMGSVGMLSAGLLGGPGIGFTQDSQATAKLRAESQAVYDRYKADEPNTFLFVFKTTGLDGTKVGLLNSGGAGIDKDPNLAKFKTWWDGAKLTAAEDKKILDASQDVGARAALKSTAVLPAIQAVILLGMLFYFRSKGGYKQVHIEGQGAGAAEVD